MKSSIVAPVVLLALAACEPADVSVQEAPPAAAVEAVAQSASTPGVAKVDGMSFRVEVAADRRSAVVGLPTPSNKFQGSDVESAAAQVSGCGAQIAPGEWAFLGDLTRFELSNLRPEIRRPFPGWAVTLDC